MCSFTKMEGPMGRETALVKLSGDLVNRADVLAWLRELAKEYFLVIVSGGGAQINEEFEKRGYGRNYGPLGRVCRTFGEKQLARDILETNQADLQDLLAREGISAIVVIPVLDIASVLCHVNGDIFVLTAYLGFDKLFVHTLQSRVGAKKEQLSRLWAVFEGEKYGQKFPPKIEVVGFPDTHPSTSGVTCHGTLY